MKFSERPEVSLLHDLLKNKTLDTSTFSQAEWDEINRRTKILAAINHSRPGGRGDSFAVCMERQRYGEVSEYALQKLINAEVRICEMHDPANNGLYHYDAVLDGRFKLEFKCLQMLNTTVSWSKLEKIQHMLEHLDDLDAIIISKWSAKANFFMPWYLLNPSTLMDKLEISKFKGLFYASGRATPGSDYILLNTELNNNFFNEFKHEGRLDAPDEVIATPEELQRAASLAETYQGLEKADLAIANHVETFTDIPF